MVVCELKESPWWQRYQVDQSLFTIEDEAKEYEEESPEHERDVVEEKGEFV